MSSYGQVQVKDGRYKFRGDFHRLEQHMPIRDADHDWKLVGVTKPRDLTYVHTYGGEAAFFESLSQGKLLATKCENPGCESNGTVFQPFRIHCPDCLSKNAVIDMTDLAKKKAKVHTFMVCARSGAFNMLDKPIRFINIEFEGVSTILFSYLLLGEPRIGMQVLPVFNGLTPRIRFLISPGFRRVRQRKRCRRGSTSRGHPGKYAVRCGARRQVAPGPVLRARPWGLFGHGVRSRKGSRGCLGPLFRADTSLASCSFQIRRIGCVAVDGSAGSGNPLLPAERITSRLVTRWNGCQPVSLHRNLRLCSILNRPRRHKRMAPGHSSVVVVVGRTGAQRESIGGCSGDCMLFFLGGPDAAVHHLWCQGETEAVCSLWCRSSSRGQIL